MAATNVSHYNFMILSREIIIHWQDLLVWCDDIYCLYLSCDHILLSQKYIYYNGITIFATIFDVTKDVYEWYVLYGVAKNKFSDNIGYH